MIEEQVAVTALDEGGVWVEGVQQSACGSCSAKAGCGKHTMSQLGRKVSLWLPDTPGCDKHFSVGEQVVVGLPEGAILRSTLVLYGIPLIFLIVGAIVGNTLMGELGSISFSVIFMLLGFKLARARAIKNQQNWQPKYIRTCLPPAQAFESSLKPIKVINT